MKKAKLNVSDQQVYYMLKEAEMKENA